MLDIRYICVSVMPAKPTTWPRDLRISDLRTSGDAAVERGDWQEALQKSWSMIDVCCSDAIIAAVCVPWLEVFGSIPHACLDGVRWEADACWAAALQLIAESQAVSDTTCPHLHL